MRGPSGSGPVLRLLAVVLGGVQAVSPVWSGESGSPASTGVVPAEGARAIMVTNSAAARAFLAAWRGNVQAGLDGVNKEMVRLRAELDSLREAELVARHALGQVHGVEAIPGDGADVAAARRRVGELRKQLRDAEADLQRLTRELPVAAERNREVALAVERVAKVNQQLSALAARRASLSQELFAAMEQEKALFGAPPHVRPAAPR